MQDHATKPRIEALAFEPITLSDRETDHLSWLFYQGSRETKMAKVFVAVVDTPLINTHQIRMVTDISNPSNAIHAINKKLMNHGLMIMREEPIGVPPNGDFHYWYLCEAPIQTLPVQMANNDPRI
ncbi:hypothetical protein [Salinivibrio costicola]|uniref:Uncharacterized protein n=1 Tax=Salinivibrio costicola subsp. alcaliphilus TaxID=272773 RepID=A0ABX3KUD2_SALCS|nr:hypothetical protein [Salinivibrio costicola]OOF35287.1 hypothetical protein BZJ21_00815 [Salinivibrio costicola subsp. alcaliphilus]